MARQPRGIKAVGFKALYDQPSANGGDWEEFWSAFGEVETLRVIHLYRNRLESVLSLRLAMENDRWIDSPYDEKPIEVDVQWVLLRMRKEVHTGSSEQTKELCCGAH